MLHHFQDNDENGGSWCYSDEVRPATKAQCDLLFKKMEEAGYQWDAEKKELKLLISNGGDFEFDDSEQKPNVNTKQEDWTEIPFGAKDSELHEVSYYIPEGFHAEINGNKVTIKRGEQKPVNDTDEEIVEAVSNTSILDMIEDKDAFTNPGAFENSLGRLLKLFEKLPKQDLLDGLKFYANVVEHDGEYNKPATWSDEDEKVCRMCVEAVEYYHTSEDESVIKDWLKSLKERIGG